MKWMAIFALAVLMAGCTTIIRKDVKSNVISEEPVVASDAVFEEKK